jgi:hypothetical protein
MPPRSAEERKAYNKAYYQSNKSKNTCEHNRHKATCKDCSGSRVCAHNRQKYQCKECGGGSICEHNKVKYDCKECGGSRFCEHSRRKSLCKECGGSDICIHNKMKYRCKECSGSQLCEHNKVKSDCKECGGSRYCEHNKAKSRCRECKGGSICEHNKHKFACKDCNLLNYLVSVQRKSIRRMLLTENLTKLKPSIEYLGCSAEYFLEYLQKKMTEDMTFNNIHIDHIKPVSRFNLQNEDEFLDCCHYTNLQPLLAEDNLIKSNKWNDTNEAFWNENIKGKEYIPIYNPLD